MAQSKGTDSELTAGERFRSGVGSVLQAKETGTVAALFSPMSGADIHDPGVSD